MLWQPTLGPFQTKVQDPKSLTNFANPTDDRKLRRRQLQRQHTARSNDALQARKGGRAMTSCLSVHTMNLRRWFARVCKVLVALAVMQSAMPTRTEPQGRWSDEGSHPSSTAASASMVKGIGPLGDRTFRKSIFGAKLSNFQKIKH